MDLIKPHINIIDCYTDGSFKKTKYSIKCGYGIYFPNKELPDVSSPFNLGTITNNRAELYAIYTALQMATKKYTFDLMNIYTDSEYCQKSLTVWIISWKKNGWLNAKKKPVENQDLIKLIDRYLEKYSGKINIQWVRSHTGAKDRDSLGNAQADMLANEGADMYGN